jgi:thiamine pyrophosphate-dependent acetolactate synthase large subunit-like protein
VSGDAAIGFSGMEIETACRYNLPVKIIVLNNGGIGSGIEALPDDRLKIPPRVMSIGSGYEKLMEAFGGRGWYVEDPKDLRKALDELMAHNGPGLVNVRLAPSAGRKPQQFGWHTS